MSNPLIEVWAWVSREETTRIEVYVDRHSSEVWVNRSDAEIGSIERNGRVLLKMPEELALKKGLL